MSIRNFLVGLLLVLVGQGCVSTAGPLAVLPIVSPQASELNLSGIKAYNSGEWVLAKQRFFAAIEVDNQLPEAHYNLALTFHRLGNYDEATESFRKAGELAPNNDSIVKSTLYRNYLGLSTTFERHMSGGYRYGP